MTLLIYYRYCRGLGGAYWYRKFKAYNYSTRPVTEKNPGPGYQSIHLIT